jgi:hypothetical protein
MGFPDRIERTVARDWDGPLHALKDHLDQHARGSADADRRLSTSNRKD